MISVLCVAPGSHYYGIPGLDLWDKERDAFKFAGSTPVICHPPCAQWSQMRGFAKDNPAEKMLAWFCLEKVLENGGILEHPAHSSFFKAAGIKPTLSIDQFWFGFPARKKTWLFFHKCKPLAVPLRFDAREKTVEEMWSTERSLMTPALAAWLVASVTLDEGT